MVYDPVRGKVEESYRKILHSAHIAYLKKGLIDTLHQHGRAALRDYMIKGVADSYVVNLFCEKAMMKIAVVSVKVL